MNQKTNPMFWTCFWLSLYRHLGHGVHTGQTESSLPPWWIKNHWVHCRLDNWSNGWAACTFSDVTVHAKMLGKNVTVTIITLLVLLLLSVIMITYFPKKSFICCWQCSRYPPPYSVEFDTNRSLLFMILTVCCLNEEVEQKTVSSAHDQRFYLLTDNFISLWS